MNDQEEEAVQFVMKFYNIDRETTIELYWDEVEAYMRLLNRMNND